MRLRYLAFGVALSLMLVALAACGGGAEPTATSRPAPAATTPPADTSNGDGGAELMVSLEGMGGNYAFAPATLTLEAGETYTINLTSTGELHTWSVKNPDDGYFEGMNIQVLANETKTGTFAAPSAPGTYTLVCIPHEINGMVGQVIVQ